MTAQERLFCVRLKVERAKKHIIDLQAAIESFHAAKPYGVATKRDSQTRKLIYYVSSVEPVPAHLSLIIGDALHNLRSALDQVAVQLVRIGIGDAADISHVAFPFCDDPAKYMNREMRRKIQGMRQDAIDAISAIEPYKGGRGHQLWVLHKLDHIDKHRLLLTVASALRSVNIGAHATGGKVDAFFRVANRMCPLKNGYTLFVGAPNEEVNEKMDFRFDVAFSEPEILESDPVIETVQQLAQLVDSVATGFEPFL